MFTRLRLKHRRRAAVFNLKWRQSHEVPLLKCCGILLEQDMGSETSGVSAWPHGPKGLNEQINGEHFMSLQRCLS